MQLSFVLFMSSHACGIDYHVMGCGVSAAECHNALLCISHTDTFGLQKITGLHLVGFHHAKYRCSAAPEVHPAPEGRAKPYPVAVAVMEIATRLLLAGGPEAVANGEGHAHGEGVPQKEKGDGEGV